MPSLAVPPLAPSSNPPAITILPPPVVWVVEPLAVLSVFPLEIETKPLPELSLSPQKIKLLLLVWMVVLSAVVTLPVPLSKMPEPLPVLVRFVLTLIVPPYTEIGPATLSAVPVKLTSVVLVVLPARKDVKVDG